MKWGVGEGVQFAYRKAEVSVYPFEPPEIQIDTHSHIPSTTFLNEGAQPVANFYSRNLSGTLRVTYQTCLMPK